MSEQTVEFVPLLDHDDYEILNQFPFTIRRKDNHLEVKEHNNQEGYPRVHLNSQTYLKHRLIALQFIPNDDPEHKNQIDHRNRIRDDYHIENLQWVSQTTNQMNKTSNRQIQYEYVSSIPDDAIVVNNYNEHKFENYYFHNDVFYFFNGIDYRKLHVIERKRGGLYVNMMNTRGVRICVYYSKFKKLYDLI
ncbi:hypothetical protein M9Y10_010260 [Tritrichomonas musculus]|uniref:HNH nuclease domain-containing protein n=2 Tax=Tritrichomonas musculus TaxID=1915356 RepID=A0ABR2GNH5_9EUKA